MTTLIFDEATHTYRVDGRECLSVTRILSMVGLIDESWRDEEALKRGSFVHSACEFDDDGTLDPATVVGSIAGYLAAWRKCKAEMGLKIIREGIEQRVVHPSLGYAGTVDRIVELAGVRYVIDLKTGSPEVYHPIQLAGYAMCFTERLQRANVYLAENGSYRWVPHTDRMDFEIWKASLTLATFRKMKGLVK